MKKDSSVSLQKFGRNFYSTLISWITDEETLMQFAGPAFSFPLTDSQLDNSLSDDKRYAFIVKENENNSIIGYAEVYESENLAWLARIIIGDENNRGKGFGQKIIALLLNFVFEELQKNEVQLNVFDWNIAAIKCYEKAGFTLNAHKKSERKIKEKIWIAVNMSINKTVWKKLNQT